jgi:hypothetical protein
MCLGFALLHRDDLPFFFLVLASEEDKATALFVDVVAMP